MILTSLFKVGAIGGLGIIGLESVVNSQMRKYRKDVLRPIDNVSIIVQSYNEAEFIGTTLSSIKNQSIIEKYPEYFELILADSCSTDGTIELAEHYIDRIIITPRGKLTSRNIAISEAKGNIIVNVDADTYYPYHWLNTLLEPFNNLKNPSIVGVFGSTYDYTMPNIPGQIFLVAEALYNSILNRTRMVGRNSALYKHTFYLADRFNENINQFNIWEIFDEEEKLFGRRLSKLGKIIYNINASCYHLGGFKSYYRFAKNKEIQDKYQFGIDRF